MLEKCHCQEKLFLSFGMKFIVCGYVKKTPMIEARNELLQISQMIHNLALILTASA